MAVLPVVCFGLSACLAISGIRYHINIFEYPPYVSIPVILAVYIPLSIIFLLPIDYVTHNSSNYVEWFSLPDSVILLLWKFSYWMTFLLTWLLLPVLQEFYRSGHYKKIHKLKDALKRNLKFQLIILLVSVCGLIYLMLEVGLTMSHMKLMIIALSHIYSLVLALWLMSHGLIGIPRERWMKGNILQYLNHQYVKVPKLVDALEDTRISFKEEVMQVVALRNSFATSTEADIELRDWILKLYNKIPEDLKESMEGLTPDDLNQISKDKLTDDYLIKLTSNFNRELYNLMAYESEFETMFYNIVYLEDILAASTNDDLSSRYLLQPRFQLHKMLFLPKTAFLLEYYVKPIFNRLMSIVLYAASFILIESEFFHSTKLSLVNCILFAPMIKNHSWCQLIISCIAFCYMLFASLNSLTHLKVFNIYHLVPFKSSPVSGCFYATYIARLTMPISYNFITLFRERNSVFERWFGQSIHLTGLFNSMNNWLPRLIIIPILLTTFNVYDKLKSKLGLSDFYGAWTVSDDESDEENQGLMRNKKDLLIVEAKRTINREVLKRSALTSSNQLRSFNLASAPNLNYERNRLMFNDSLASMNERIDDSTLSNEADSYRDDNSRNGSTVWSKLSNIGATFDTIKSKVAERLEPNIVLYRDLPERDEDHDGTIYDDENLVI